MYQQTIKMTILSTINMLIFRPIISLCKHNCLNKVIILIIFTLMCPILKSREIINVATINKRPIGNERKSKYRENFKTRSKPSVPKTFRSVPSRKLFIQFPKRLFSLKAFRFVPKAFRSVLKPFSVPV